MKTVKILMTATLGVALPVALMTGCGGGGGGGSSNPGATSTPRATSTPAAGARSLLVQLRDASENPVDGIVTVGSAVLPTSGGAATFRGLSAGATTVKAEVNGVTTMGTVTVASTGATTFNLVISASVTPGPTSSPPPPPA